MNNNAIRVEELSKSYRLGKREVNRTLGDTLASAFSSPFRRLRSGADEERETIWSLKDISFDVERGQAIGIIGANGAGKSTLLKVLSRITEPTLGTVMIHGRVAALLEVGTGFHSELTGRENIFLNAAILGMRNSEIRRKFDEILAFAEVEKFIDTPVKHYSSGMAMRLAFAVAAHLEPEILVVDEVLAVGDAAFQRKCLGKMNGVAREGRTVIFVSHNLPAVLQLTTHSIYLCDGRLRFYGPTAEAINHYQQAAIDRFVAVHDLESWPRPMAHLRREVEFVGAAIEASSNLIAGDEEVRLRLRIRANQCTPNLRVSFTIFNVDGVPVGSGFAPPAGSLPANTFANLYLSLTDHKLAPGRYYFALALGKGNHREGHSEFDFITDICHFQVVARRENESTISKWSPLWGPICYENAVCTLIRQN